MPSIGIAIAPQTGTVSSGAISPGAWLSALAANFRRLDQPVIARIHEDRLLLDLRCLDDPQPLIALIQHLDLPQ